MNVISISTDRQVFNPETAVAQRMIDYGTLFDQLHIVVFTKASLNLKPLQLATNVWLYPTQSTTRWNYISQAKQIAQDIIKQHSLSPQNTVVTTQDPFETGLVGRWLAKRGYKLQVQIHTDFLSPWFKKSSWLNRIRVWLSPLVLRKAKAIRVVSQRIKDSLLKKGYSSEIISVLPIFVPQPTQTKPHLDLHIQYPQWATIILMASRLSPEKNIAQALESFKPISIEHPSVGLVIVGDGSEHVLLKQKVAKLGLRNNVVFCGWQAQMTDYFATADIFLANSLYEGYGLTLVEAALAGKAIISTDVGLIGSILHNETSAMVIPVNNGELLTKAIKKLATNKELRQTLGNQAKIDVQRGIVTEKSAYLAAYKKALEL